VLLIEPYHAGPTVSSWPSLVTDLPVSLIPSLTEMTITESPAYAQLKSVFKGEMVLPSDAEYKDSLKRWSVLAERQAGMIAFVKDEDDVAAAVKFAVEAKLEIAIKGRSSLRSNVEEQADWIKVVVIILQEHLLPMGVSLSTFPNTSTRLRSTRISKPPMYRAEHYGRTSMKRPVPWVWQLSEVPSPR